MDMLPDQTTGQRLAMGGDEIVVLATCVETDGALFAVQVRMPAGGGPPVLHQHAPGEVYHVLSGQFTFYTVAADGAVSRRTAGTGEVVALAGGTPHTVRNESDEDAVAFVVHAPGAPMEGFVRAVAALGENGSPPSMEAVLRVAAQNGIELLGPVPDVPDRA